MRISDWSSDVCSSDLVSAGYVTGSVFVLAISAWYLLRCRNLQFARRSLAVAASFGLASALSVVVLGDESGYTASADQKMKVAAIEAEWETQPAPARITLFGFTDLDTQETRAAVRIPWAFRTEWSRDGKEGVGRGKSRWVRFE